MSRPKERISVSGPQEGLNNAFAGLSIGGLPDGPELSVQAEAVSTKPGRVVIRRETAHRGGKTVLVIDGFGLQHPEEAIEELGRRLRAACGCGGTRRGRVIELQGDKPAKVRALLEADGFVVVGER